MRRATLADLPAIMALEEAAFDPPRRVSRAVMRRSLTSPTQSVHLVEQKGQLVAMLVLRHHASFVRVFDIATHPDVQGQGLGSKLLAFAESQARKQKRVVLEADAKDAGLLAWYRKRGYRDLAVRRDYYGKNRHALRLTKSL